jgi:hypothetical protein
VKEVNGKNEKYFRQTHFWFNMHNISDTSCDKWASMALWKMKNFIEYWAVDRQPPNIPVL